MQIVIKKIDDLKPYERNPRRNDEAVKYVMQSIKQFGFKVPMVIDSNGVIVAGHTRYKAAKKLGLSEIPCVIADDLSKEQIQAFRLADNKVGEIATWDFDLLNIELGELASFDFDMGDLGFYNGVDENEFDHLFESGGESGTEEKKNDEPEAPAVKEYLVVIHADTMEEAKEIAADLEDQGYECEVRG